MSAFDRGRHYQDAPGFVEYTAYDTDVVSAELPCGAAWLVNCLVELDVAVSKPWNAHVADEWQRLDSFSYRYARADEPWKRTLPALVHNRIFQFRDQPVPRVSHAWPRQYEAASRTILFVRDPRDALYSAWQRARLGRTIGAELGFAEWAGARFFHYPFSTSEYLLLFLRLWREALRDRDALVVRYEDYRYDAVSTLRRVINFLRMHVEDADLRRAVGRSDFSVLKIIEATQLERGEIAVALNRAGCAYEYVDVFDAQMHAAVGPRFADIFSWLGYEPDRSRRTSVQPLAARDVDTILQAMQADQMPPGADDWLRVAVAKCSRDFEIAYA